ncbi:MAG: Glu-tRNA(Gln) amidotransferase subunit GatE [Candidatus Cloacimonetes bacterium]|nr:Glu-tRNA(Gln) amidotransferase subunit GatE [Candidatus Cloacimonadota bacterium]
MSREFDPKQNYESSCQKTGYVTRDKATTKTYRELGFKCGLEVHQQLATREKLFCRCPVGIYQDFADFDAEVIRHMRPTLSEMGTYDGTALMEFKTRKNITYRIKNETTCTYEVDDTPPFPINREALAYAVRIALLLQCNIVGELHITRKQYLDGSIPTGFQRTAIVGIDGEMPVGKKKIRIIQLSVEEDACREVSDHRHERIYTTDRLGIPLIETVTYPDMMTPEEAEAAGQYIRFLNRSSGLVRKGSGAGREDVNVSITGGTRVEIKGVSHISWIPALTHNEAFRQKALLLIRDELVKRIPKPEDWKPVFKRLNFDVSDIQYPPIKQAVENGWQLIAVNLPQFRGILSFFTQPGKTFASEIEGRLKVIACLELPNMVHSEDLQPVFDENMLKKRSRLLGCTEQDAQIVFWAPEEDVACAMYTIEERCRMALAEVPNETRKALPDGTTIFERVLPGADRMYPDTDSAPIPISDDYIEELRQQLPKELALRLQQLADWNIPADTHHYLLRNNLIPLLEKIITDFGIEPVFLASLLAHRLKHIEGRQQAAAGFDYKLIYDLFRKTAERKVNYNLLPELLPILYEHPQLDFDSLLHLAGFKKTTMEKLLGEVPGLAAIFRNIKRSRNPLAAERWIMGNLRAVARGNVDFNLLQQEVRKILSQLPKDES